MASGPLSRPITVSGPCGTTVEWLPARGYETHYVADRPSIGIAVDVQFGEDAIGTDRSRPFCAHPNTLAIVPAGVDVWSRSSDGGEYLRIVGIEPMLDARFGASVGMLAARNNLRAPEVADRSRTLRRLLLNDPTDLAAIEASLFGLIDSFLATLSNGPPAADVPLDSRRLRLVVEQVEALLQEPLPTATLARTVGLSEGHFYRAFARSTGMTPQRYVSVRRLARASELLADPHRTLVEIATDCGFSSQSHFGARFRACYGMTPGAFRRRTIASRSR